MVIHPTCKKINLFITFSITIANEETELDFFLSSVKEFTMYEDLEEIVQLASQPIPERKTFASND